MIINQAFRYELDPTYAQAVSLAKCAGTARYAYNWALVRRIALYKHRNKSIDAMKLHKWWNIWKSLNAPWAYDVSKCCAQEAFRDLDKAFKSFFKKKSRFPKFKKKHVHDSFRLTGFIKAEARSVQLPRLGRIKTKEDTSKLTGKILSATISRQAHKWYVSFAVEREIEPPVNNGGITGIDVGLSSFATLADGTRLNAPKPLNKYQRMMRRLQRSTSRKVKGSKNHCKAKARTAKLHMRIANIRKDWLHKESTKLAKTKSVVVMEDLNIAQLVHKPLRGHAKAWLDSGIGIFRNMLAYKTKWYGSKLVLVDKWFASSKICSDCYYKNKELTLAERQWACCSCGSIHDRDVNAAKNLVNYYLGRVPPEVTPEESPLSGGKAASLQSPRHDSLNQETSKPC